MKTNFFKYWKILQYIVLVSLWMSAMPNAFGQLIPTDMVAYYPFNGNANDESGNGRNPIYVHETWATTDRFGRANCAKYFDGNDYIQGSAVGLPTGDRTISLWLNRESVTPIAQICAH
jgi:hypothetical protein